MPIAIVTGANRGLGLETSRGLAKRGYRVWLTGRDGVHVGDAVVALRATGLDVVGTTLDIADAASIREFADRFSHAKEGPIDALVNNAGVSLNGFDANVARVTIDNNYRGAVRLTDALRRRLASHADIVMVSSGMGELSSFSDPLKARLLAPTLTRAQIEEVAAEFISSVAAGTHRAAGFPANAYGVSKALMNAFTRVLARELPAGQRVNAVCPGWVKTRMGGSAATRSAEQGASGIVWAATLDDDGPTGGFFRDGKPIAW